LASALPAAGDDVLIELEELLQDLDGALLCRNVSCRVSVLAYKKTVAKDARACSMATFFQGTAAQRQVLLAKKMSPKLGSYSNKLSTSMNGHWTDKFEGIKYFFNYFLFVFCVESSSLSYMFVP
jgi:hypothetical protein